MSELTEGVAYTIVDNAPGTEGLEAWRRLHERFAKTKTQTTIMQLVAIVSTKLTENNFESIFAQWETNITKYEAAVGK